MSVMGNNGLMISFGDTVEVTSGSAKGMRGKAGRVIHCNCSRCRERRLAGSSYLILVDVDVPGYGMVSGVDVCRLRLSIVDAVVKERRHARQ